jgi:hypothetical protein
MDPTGAIIAPWAQFGIVGSVTLALGVAVIYLWRSLHEAKEAHLAEVRACAAQMLDVTIRKIESDNRLADALEGVEKVVEAALAAMRK